MTPAEHARLNVLCKRIKDEQNPTVFNRLLVELNEFLGGTPEAAEGQKPVQIHPEAILRCAYCRLGNEFQPMTLCTEGWFQCEGCGHNVMPLDPEFKCTCEKCEGHTSPLVPPTD